MPHVLHVPLDASNVRSPRQACLAHSGRRMSHLYQSHCFVQFDIKVTPVGHAMGTQVPSEYALTILSECAAFPRRLIFFLKATFTVRSLRQDSFLHIAWFRQDSFNAPPERLPRYSLHSC